MKSQYYQINELKASIDALLAHNPELRDDDVLRADMFEGETDISAVLTMLVKEEREAEHSAQAISAWKEELSERQARFGRRKDVLRGLMQSIMERADLPKIVLPEATLSISFRKPSPVVTNPDEVPDAFCKFERRPDLAKIKEAAELPPGVAMSNGKQVLTVRTK